MAITAHLCRANAEDCARQAKLSIHPNASAAYQELVRAWLVLADTAEQLTKLRRVERAKPAITAKARLTHVAQNCSLTYGLNATAKLWNGQSPRIVLATPLEIARADYTPIPAGTPSRLAAEMGTTAAKDRTEEYCRHRFEAFANSSPVEDAYDCSGIQQRAKAIIPGSG